jgi:MFS family permease
MTQVSIEEKSFKTSVLVVAAFASFFPSFLASAINLALPAIGREFNTDAILLGWIINSLSIASGISLLIFGRLGDIVGRKKIFFLGILFNTLSTFLIVFSQNIIMVILFRIAQGLSIAMIFSTVTAIVTAVFSAGERGKALGINLTSIYLGLSLGPVLGGFLIEYLGWRSIFLFIVPFQIIAIFLIKQKIKAEWADSAGEKFDFKGSVVYAFAMFGIMYGFSILPSAMGWICLAGGILFGIMFVSVERKTDNPIFNFSILFNNRMFVFSCLASIIFYTAISAIGFFTSLYLQHIQDLDATTAGFIMIAQPLGTALLSILSGKLSDRINPGIIASTGMGIVSLGLFLLFFINENTQVVHIISFLVLIGLGFGLFSSPNTNAIMSSVDKKYLGIASGTLGTMRTIGNIFSMGIAMMLFTFHIGREIITPSIYPELLMAIRTGFLVFAIVSAFGVFVSLARSTGKKKL